MIAVQVAWLSQCDLQASTSLTFREMSKSCVTALPLHTLFGSKSVKVTSTSELLVVVRTVVSTNANKKLANCGCNGISLVEWVTLVRLGVARDGEGHTWSSK